MEYKIINQSGVAIIAFQGDITRADRERLDKCLQEVNSIETKVMILLFKNVSNVEQVAFRDLTILQHDARKKKINLRVVGLGPGLKHLLSERGVIRTQELKNTLDEALLA